ncbi:MAG: hypothetical protein O7F74_09200 [Bacteroidetes bacterium]|nr:hypothetical protein [Bacteroidota bacterium]
MIPEIRARYNREFTREKYQAFLAEITAAHNYRPGFRIAETPVFIPNYLRLKIREATDEITEVFCQPDFKEQTKDAIFHPENVVPKEDYHARFIQVDFGICTDENGQLTPQLIEVQGFPSLYFFQDLLAKTYRNHFHIHESLKHYPGNITPSSYKQLLKEVIVGDNDPKNVVLLELEPEKQTTFVDYLGAQKGLGIKVLDIIKMLKEGRKLFYRDEEGKKVPIYKIYNRVIFDELALRPDIKRQFYFKDEVDVEWVGHPNWFFRISKYIMPRLKSKYVPKSYYLDKLVPYPDDLENYVLKPLYSFAGAGVKLHVSKEDLDSIDNKANFILQEKVKYEPLIETPTGTAKCEFRVMTIWQPGQRKAQIVNNLVSITKGEMVGVKYNIDKDWVGASIAFLEFA